MSEVIDFEAFKKKESDERWKFLFEAFIEHMKGQTENLKDTTEMIGALNFKIENLRERVERLEAARSLKPLG